MATNRTLQFLGYALGTSPVQITASINDTVVFTGPVETLDPGLKYSLDASPYPVLFSVDSTDLFPTTFSGSYPVTMTVTGGDSVTFGTVLCNYMLNFEFDELAQLSNTTINGTTLTFDSATGPVSNNLLLKGLGIEPHTHITDGSGTTWTVNKNQTVVATIGHVGRWIETVGNATGFTECYDGYPTNSEGTTDARSSVAIDGVVQVPNRISESQGAWTWTIESGSTMTHNLNVGPGNVVL